MSGLHEAVEDIAAEITPIDPPVEQAMRRGRRKRYARRAVALAGTASAVAIVTGVATAIPARPGHPPSAPGPGAVSSAPAGVPLARPVLLESPTDSTLQWGDPHLVNAATLRLFHQLTCSPAVTAQTVDDSWRATVGYTAAQWNAPGSQVVSCDVSGSKYVLGPAAILGSQLTSVAVSHRAGDGHWVVTVTLNNAATAVFGRLTTSQSRLYYPNAAHDINDAVLDDIAIVINGDVHSIPQTTGPITNGRLQIAGPQPGGMTQAGAQALGAYLMARMPPAWPR